ncbi:MAG: FimV/HubP family polar landmark protein [Pseudomonadota bacterium]
MRKLLVVVLFLAVVAPFKALALGLGEIKLDSALNEPLSAEIELLSPGELRAADIIANLASDREFQRSGIERFFYLNSIRFNTLDRGNGRFVVELTTREPIKEPFVNFLVELSWPAGKIVREYTLLLDPPIFSEDEIASSSQPAVASTSSSVSQTVGDSDPLFDDIQDSENLVATSRTVPVIELDDTQEVVVSNDEFEASFESEPLLNSGDYVVGAGETAYGIARNLQPNGANIYQTIVAIYEANPTAFSNGNINQLQRGANLRLPDTDEILAQDRAQSTQFVTAQIQSFEASRGMQRISVAPETEIADAGSGPRDDRLRLVTPDGEETGEVSSGGVGGEIASLRRKLVSARETAETLKQENVELRDRLEALSQQVEKMQRLMSLKDQELAALQVKLGEEPLVIDDNQFAVEDEFQQDNQQELSIDEPDPLQVAEPSPFKAEEPSLIESLGLDTATLLGIGGGLVLLVGVVVVYMRRRISEDEFQDSLLAGEFDADMTFTTDFNDVNDDVMSNSIGEEMSQDNIAEMDADPVSEADVYIAYGKYEQAEELLKAALEDAPEQIDVNLKLFECYAAAKEQEKFQDHMDECVNLMDSNPAFEQQVMAMFNENWPDANNPVSAFGAPEELPSTDDIFSSVDDTSSSSFDEGIASNTEDDNLNLDSFNSSVESSPNSSNESLNQSSDFFNNNLDAELGIDTPATNDDLDGSLDDLDFDLDDDPSLSSDFDLETDKNKSTASNSIDFESTMPNGLNLETEEPTPKESNRAIDDLNRTAVREAISDEDLSRDLDFSVDSSSSNTSTTQKPSTSTTQFDSLDSLDDIDIDFEQDMLEQLGGDMDDSLSDIGKDNDETSIRPGLETGQHDFRVMISIWILTLWVQP